jgi:hypothetical protein
VELYRDNQLSQSVQTDANGGYTINGVEPNDQTTIRYELRFRAPGAGANTAMLGRAVSSFTNGMQRITDIVVRSRDNLQGLNLPIHPNGVIYNSMGPYTGCRGDSHPAGCPQRLALAGGLLRRCGPARTDHAR